MPNIIFSQFHYSHNFCFNLLNWHKASIIYHVLGLIYFFKHTYKIFFKFNINCYSVASISFSATKAKKILSGKISQSQCWFIIWHCYAVDSLAHLPKSFSILTLTHMYTPEEHWWQHTKTQVHWCNPGSCKQQRQDYFP